MKMMNFVGNWGCAIFCKNKLVIGADLSATGFFINFTPSLDHYIKEKSRLICKAIIS